MDSIEDSSRDIEIVEASGLGPVWAMTFQGAKARLFRWTKSRWEDMTSHYIDANSPEAEVLSRHYLQIRDESTPAATQPATRATGYAQSTTGHAPTALAQYAQYAQPTTTQSTPGYGQQSAAASTPKWTWDPSRKQHYWCDTNRNVYVFEDGIEMAGRTV